MLVYEAKGTDIYGGGVTSLPKESPDHDCRHWISHLGLSLGICVPPQEPKGDVTCMQPPTPPNKSSTLLSYLTSQPRQSWMDSICWFWNKQKWCLENKVTFLSIYKYTCEILKIQKLLILVICFQYYLKVFMNFPFLYAPSFLVPFFFIPFFSSLPFFFLSFTF